MLMLSTRRYLFSAVMKHSASALALLLISMVGASAETLNEALQLASIHNPTLSAERARMAQAKAKIEESRAGWLPKVNVEGSAGSEKINTDLSAEFGGSNVNRTLNYRSVGLVVEQNLYDSGKTNASTSRDQQNLQAQKAHFNQTEQQVFFSVATAYLDVILKQSILELEQHNVETLKQQLSATRLREQAGELTHTDVYQAQARFAQAKALQSNAEARLAQARAAFVRNVGSAPDNLIPPTDLAGLPETLNVALQQARQKHPALLQARYALAAAHDNLDVVRAGGHPTLTLVGAVQHRENDAIFTDRTNTQSLMLNVNVPIYAGGADDARTQQAVQLAAQKQYELDTRRDRIIENVTSAWESWQVAKTEVAALDEQRHASESALEGVRAEQRAGSRTVLDVLNAQQELLNAQVGVASAKRDLQVNAYQLRAAIGNLTSESLGLVAEDVKGK